jgi:hypothetical protein
MGRWQAAADGIRPGTNRIRCDLQRFLLDLPPDERAELQAIIDHANERIPSGKGRYSYVHDVILAGGGPELPTTSISRHMRGLDSCRGS